MKKSIIDQLIIMFFLVSKENILDLLKKTFWVTTSMGKDVVWDEDPLWGEKADFVRFKWRDESID